MKDLCQRYVDILDGRRAKVTLDTGKIYIGAFNAIWYNQSWKGVI